MTMTEMTVTEQRTATVSTARPQPVKSPERVLVVPQRARRPASAEPEPAARYEPALPIDCILAFAMNPRTEFEAEPLAELAASIERCGVLQPILVRTGVHRHGKQFYDLVAGERRLRAAQAAGLTTVPAIIRREMLHTDAVFAALAENMHRQDLTCIEIARTVQTLMTLSSPQVTQTKICREMGISASSLSCYLGLLKLPNSVQVLIKSRQLSFSRARQLFYYWREHPEVDVEAAAQTIVAGGISCNQLARDFARSVFGTSDFGTSEGEGGEEEAGEGEPPKSEVTKRKPRIAGWEPKPPARQMRPKSGTNNSGTDKTGTSKSAPGSRQYPNLTRTEVIVLNLYVHALTPLDIAEKMGVAKTWVDTCLASIQRRLGARSMMHAFVILNAIRLPKEYAMPDDWDAAKTSGQERDARHNNSAAVGTEKASVV